MTQHLLRHGDNVTFFTLPAENKIRVDLSYKGLDISTW